MIVKLGRIIKQYRKIDQAILILRLLISVLLIVHVVRKALDYQLLMDSYPPLIFNSPRASFIILASVELLCAISICAGLWIRFAAFIMLLGIIVDIILLYPAIGWFGIERQVLYGVVYIFMMLSGAGKYALDYHFTTKREEY